MALDSVSEMESESSLCEMQHFADEPFREFRPRGVYVGRRNSLGAVASMARSATLQVGRLAKSVSRIPKVREVSTLIVAAAGLLALALFLRQQPDPVDIVEATEFVSVLEEGSSLIWMNEESVNRNHRETFLTNPPVDMARLTCQLEGQTNASGNWLWSDSQQKGFVTFSGLPINNPSQFQYQAWIFDTKVNQKYPVSAGVFNVVNENESIILLLPDFRINKAVRFMVTQENPGGVAASSRENVVAVATFGK